MQRKNKIIQLLNGEISDDDNEDSCGNNMIDQSNEIYENMANDEDSSMSNEFDLEEQEEIVDLKGGKHQKNKEEYGKQGRDAVVDQNFIMEFETESKGKVVGKSNSFS